MHLFGDNGIVTRSREAAFKAEMQQYLDDTNVYVFEKESNAIELYAGITSVKDYIYAGDTGKNKSYMDNLQNVIDVLENFWSQISSDTSYRYVNTDLKDVTKIQTEDYIKNLAIVEGNLTWFDQEKNRDSELIKWCLDLGIKVFIDGFGYLESSGNYEVGTDGTYTNAINGTMIPSGVACCSPDLTGFNTSCTWYLEYSDVNSSNPLYRKLIYKDAPNDWYDYGNKKWANIVTTSKNGVSYWTWIPRYQYKVGTDGQIASAGAESNVMFIDVSKVTPDDGYQIPDAFKQNGKEVAGIWVGKYEISEPEYAVGFSATSTENSITVSSLTVKGSSKSSDTTENVSETEVYVEIKNGDSVIQKFGSKDSEGVVTETVKLPVTTSIELSTRTKYDIYVTIPSKFGSAYDTELHKSLYTTAGVIAEITAPDLSGFNPENTYYVDCSTSKFSILGKIDTKTATIGKESRVISKDYNYSKDESGNVVNTSTDWYDYENKKWANIVTFKKSSEGNGLTGEAAYFTWVPRYEYVVDDKNNTINIVYITKDQKEPDEGYIIPDAFKFGGENLAGMWVSKYEVQNIAIPKGFTTKAISGGFMIDNLIYEGTSTKSGMPDTGELKVYKKSDNTLVKNITSFKVNNTKVEGLEGGSYIVSYKIPVAYDGVISSATSNNFVTQYKELRQEVYVKNSMVVNEPDLSGFYPNPNKKGATDKTYVYYVDYVDGNSSDTSKHLVGDRVTFDENGNVTSTPPENWYDYVNKKWANIIVSDSPLEKGMRIDYSTLYNNTNITMWVWVPRYEYNITNQVETLFVSGTAGAHDNNYAIPDAFKFNEKDLTGIWVGKYEVGDYPK